MLKQDKVYGWYGYANINMNFYRIIQQLDEKKFEFNLKTFPIYLEATKRIKVSHWYAGMKYLFLNENAEYTGDHLLSPDFVKPKEYSSIVSQLGAIIELDNRNNISLQNKGIKVHYDINRSDNIF